MNIKIVNDNPYKFNTLTGTPLQGVSVSITGKMTWTGITNTSGKVTDILGNVPELLYGNYNTLSSLFGYKDNITSFNVPETTKLNIVMSKFLLTTIESFDHTEPPSYILNFIEAFDT